MDIETGRHRMAGFHVVAFEGGLHFQCSRIIPGRRGGSRRSPRKQAGLARGPAACGLSISCAFSASDSGAGHVPGRGLHCCRAVWLRAGGYEKKIVLSHCFRPTPSAIEQRTGAPVYRKVSCAGVNGCSHS